MRGGRELGQLAPPLRSLSGSSGCCPWRVRGGRSLDLGSEDGGGKLQGFGGLGFLVFRLDRLVGFGFGFGFGLLIVGGGALTDGLGVGIGGG